ncbi:UNVERIFIED_CONTAM: hypothetical protein Sradi_3521800 [Sesamum radiatum]|uniref:DUF676 domain-containing protein n=1 Tax=Sesamum radiatum TaxID=300843 RepID=A0AAW2QFG3_SESRA
MGSMEMENMRAETVGEEKVDQEKQMGLEENNLSNQSIKKKEIRKQKKRKFRFIPRFGCMRLDDGFRRRSSRMQRGVSTWRPVATGGITCRPICAQNWRYAAKQFVKAYPNDVLVHFITQFDFREFGHAMNKPACKVPENAKWMNFVQLWYDFLPMWTHIGNLATNAREQTVFNISKKIFLLFNPNELPEYGSLMMVSSNTKTRNPLQLASISESNSSMLTFDGVDVMGKRLADEVPVFCGFYTMEKVASRASWMLGRTGRHLFLSDCDEGKPPLLLRMSSDSEDLKFISALQLFKRRVAYSNAQFDHLVGWSSASLRSRIELPKRRSLLKNDKYPHIVNEEKSCTENPQQEVSSKVKVARRRTAEMEETMLRGLTRLSWERVDVSFKGSMQRLLAHNTIQACL